MSFDMDTLTRLVCFFDEDGVEAQAKRKRKVKVEVKVKKKRKEKERFLVVVKTD